MLGHEQTSQLYSTRTSRKFTSRPILNINYYVRYAAKLVCTAFIFKLSFSFKESLSQHSIVATRKTTHSSNGKL